MKTSWKRATFFMVPSAIAAASYPLWQALTTADYTEWNPAMWMVLIIPALAMGALAGLGLHFITEGMFRKDTDNQITGP